MRMPRRKPPGRPSQRTTIDVKFRILALISLALVAGCRNRGDVVDGLIKMNNIESASAFAVTVEKRGGSVSPTLESMQVMGTI